MRLVYLSPVPWASFAQRPHKFAEWFNLRTGNAVLWVDPYPTRLPKWSDLKRLKGNISLTNSVVPDWMTIVKPSALPIEPLFGAAGINRLLWKGAIQAIQEFVDVGDAIVVIGKPSDMAVELLDVVDSSLTIYDAMDDFPAFHKGLSRRSLAATEKKIAQRVGLMWASSTALQKRWSAFRDRVALVLNGQDFAALQALNSERKLSSGPTVFGYVGSIESWFDWEWVLQLAHSHSQSIVRLIGPMHRQPPRALPPNIEFFPACSHSAALEAMCSFDIGLIPFKINTLTHSVDPVKFYEYMAIGLPVISTNFGEMSYRAGVDGVFICESTVDIESVVERAMNFSFNEQQREAFVLECSWVGRFDGTKLLEHVASRSRTGGGPSNEQG